MATTITFFPVGNGDMTLVELASGHQILLDVNIRASADDPNDPTPDVAGSLRAKLKQDDRGRPFVDAFLLSHPDQDHCSGLKEHFHLGPLSTLRRDSKQIIIRELWSSPMVFRRASRHHVLCEDAEAFRQEARRRVAKFRKSGRSGITHQGDSILVLGKDENGKTDDLNGIVVPVDETFSRINGEEVSSMSARLLGPFSKFDDDEDEELHSKNNSSTIIQFSFSVGGKKDVCHFLTGGDAEVAIWERLWQRHQERPDCLTYDVLQAPHHCSWHSLSYDSWREKKGNAVVCPDARAALSCTREGAVIVSSSNAIKDDHNDPPCIQAKQEYEAILQPSRGEFHCVGEPEGKPEALEIEIEASGPRIKSKPLRKGLIIGSGAIGRTQQPHGSGLPR